MLIKRTLFLATILVLIGAGWSAFWLYAAREADRRLEAWQAQETASGRVWTCPNRATSGFPFSITIACIDATFVGSGSEHIDIAKVAHVTATVTILHPQGIALVLRPPFSYRTSDGATDVTASWVSLAIDLASSPSGGAADMLGADVAVEGVFGQSGRRSGKAARLTAHVELPDQAQTAPDPTLAFTIAVGDTDLAPLNDLFGDTRPVDIDLSGRLDRAEIGTARTAEGVVDGWRRAGGRVDLASARLSRGQSLVTASGTLGLDEAHRPEGRLQAQFVGLGPVLQRYGINPGLVAAGSLLSSLFGGGAKKIAPGAISLPINLHDGALGIGPIETSVTLPALY